VQVVVGQTASGFDEQDPRHWVSVADPCRGIGWVGHRGALGRIIINAASTTELEEVHHNVRFEDPERLTAFINGPRRQNCVASDLNDRAFRRTWDMSLT
jgi:hypothetical protein